MRVHLRGIELVGVLACCFARYIAISAFFSKACKSSPSTGQVLTPMLA